MTASEINNLVVYFDNAKKDSLITEDQFRAFVKIFRQYLKDNDGAANIRER